MVHKVNSGHPGGSLGCTEFMIALFNEIMELEEGFDMDGKNINNYIVSEGHKTQAYNILVEYPEEAILEAARILKSGK